MTIELGVVFFRVWGFREVCLRIKMGWLGGTCFNGVRNCIIAFFVNLSFVFLEDSFFLEDWFFVFVRFLEGAVASWRGW